MSQSVGLLAGTIENFIFPPSLFLLHMEMPVCLSYLKSFEGTDSDI